MTEPAATNEFVPPDFSFNGVRFTWVDEGFFDGYEPVDPPESNLYITVNFQWVGLNPLEENNPNAIVNAETSEVSEYTATVLSLPHKNTGRKARYDIYDHLIGKGVADTPQEAIRLALAAYSDLLMDKAKSVTKYAEEISKFSKSDTWVLIGPPPAWDDPPEE